MDKLEKMLERAGGDGGGVLLAQIGEVTAGVLEGGGHVVGSGGKGGEERWGLSHRSSRETMKPPSEFPKG
jgi:hypothetical protein